MNRKLILYIACSLDGFIAGENDDLSFLDAVQQEGEDYGYGDFYKSIDTIILGRKTYDKVLSFGIPFPHAEKDCYVITSQEKASDGKLHFYNGDLEKLIHTLKAGEGKNIFCDGGAAMVNTLIGLKAIDEFIISFIPVLLGSGVRLFGDHNPETKLKFLNSRSFQSGLLQVHYEKKD